MDGTYRAYFLSLKLTNPDDDDDGDDDDDDDDDDDLHVPLLHLDHSEGTQLFLHLG